MVLANYKKEVSGKITYENGSIEYSEDTKKFNKMDQI